MKPAVEIAAGTFVRAQLDGHATLCLKVEREGKEHINHFLVPLDPVGDRRALALVYIDPNEELAPVDGVSLAFSDTAAEAPEVGDAFLHPAGPMLKVMDDPRAQRLWAYVDVHSGQVRPRMERHAGKVLDWVVTRV